MRHVLPCWCVVLFSLGTQLRPAKAFVKLLPVGQKVEFRSNVQSITVSHTFHRSESPINQLLELEVNFTRTIKDLKLQFSYYITHPNGSIQTTLTKRTVDLCFYFRNSNSDRVVKLMYDYTRERTNLPLQCPIMPGSYHVRHIRPADVPLPAFLPEAYVLFEALYRSAVRRETLFEFRFYVKLVRFVENIF